MKYNTWHHDMVNHRFIFKFSERDPQSREISSRAKLNQLRAQIRASGGASPEESGEKVDVLQTLRREASLVTDQAQGEAREKILENLKILIAQESVPNKRSELQTLYSFLNNLNNAYVFINVARRNYENAKKIIESYQRGEESIVVTDTFKGFEIGIIHGLAAAADILLPFESISPIDQQKILKYLHPQAVSYAQDKIFSGKLREQLHTDQDRFKADFLPKLRPILSQIETRKVKSISDVIQDKIRTLSQNAEVFEAYDRSIQEFYVYLTGLRSENRSDALFDRVDHLYAFKQKLDKLYKNFHGLERYVQMVRTGQPVDAQNKAKVPQVMAETLVLADQLFGSTAIYRDIFNYTDLLHPDAIVFVRNAEPLQKARSLKQTIDSFR